MTIEELKQEITSTLSSPIDPRLRGDTLAALLISMLDGLSDSIEGPLGNGSGVPKTEGFIYEAGQPQSFILAEKPVYTFFVTVSNGGTNYKYDWVVEAEDKTLSILAPNILEAGDEVVICYLYGNRNALGGADIINDTITSASRTWSSQYIYDTFRTLNTGNGQIGPAGPPGAEGPKGEKGNPGSAGPPGPKGDTGATGAQGTPGVAGTAGPKGDKGDTGATGPAGPKGDTGEQGAQGPIGPKGDTGADGLQGPEGPSGIAVETDPLSLHKAGGTMTGTAVFDHSDVEFKPGIDMRGDTFMRFMTQGGEYERGTVYSNDNGLHLKADVGRVYLEGTVEASNIVYASDFIIPSDIALKVNFKQITGVSHRIDKLSAWEFNWRKDGTSDIGLKAQDVQDQFPELVVAQPDGSLAIKYSKFAIYLLEAFKEQSLVISQLQKEVQELKNNSYGIS